MLKILILANCQTTALAHILTNVLNKNGKELVEIIHCHPVYQMSDKDNEHLITLLHECDVLLYQPHQKGKWAPNWRSSDFWLTNTSAKHTFSFPSLFFSGYNPELTYIKKTTGQRLNEGFSDYHDKRIVSLFLEGKSDQIIADSYQRLQLTPDDIKHNYINAINELKKREHEQNLNIFSASFIEENFKKERLFHTFNHPSNSVLFHIVKQLFELLNIQNYVLPNITRELLKYDSFPITTGVHDTLTLIFQRSCNTDYLIQNTQLTPRQLVSRYTEIYRKNTEHLESIKSKLTEEHWFKKKKLMLHIGQSKTATTSIQNLLAHAEESLKKESIYYPKVGLIGTAHFGVSEYYLKPKKERTLVTRLLTPLKTKPPEQTLIEKIKENFEASGCDTLVLSSEMFEAFSKKHIEQLIHDFSEYDIVAICILRGRLRWLNSMYNEVVKKAMYTGEYEKFLQFNEPVTKQIYRKLNTMVFLHPWIQVLGQRLTVVDMDNSPSILKSILNILGIYQTDNFIKETKNSRLNQSVDATSIEIIRRFYQQQRLENIPYNIATRFTNRVNRELNKKGLINKKADSFFNTDEQILKLTSHFLEDDLKLQKFCGFDRNDLHQAAGFNFVDSSDVERIYKDVKSDLLAWYPTAVNP